MNRRIVEFAGILCTVLVTGVFWGTWFTLTRTIENFSPGAFIDIGTTIIRNVATPMAILMPATLLLQLLATIQSRRQQSAMLLFGIAFLLMLVTLLITVLIEVPIDNQVKTWTVETIPTGWESLRVKWSYYHTVRTFTAVGSTVFFIAGMQTAMAVKNIAGAR